MTVYGGTPKISLGQKRDTDYEAKRNAAANSSVLTWV